MSRLRCHMFLAALCGVFLLGAAPSAWAAQTLGSMTNSLYDSLLSLQTFLSLLSYILGVFFTITGLQQLRGYVDDPNQNPPKGFVMRLAAAAFFIFSPTLANLIVESIGGGKVGGGELMTFKLTSGTTVTGDGDGLDGALVRFVMDFAEPFLSNLIPFFAYVTGIIFMLIGLKRLALANGEGPQAPGGMGTMSTFFVAAMLMSFGYIMYTFNISIFGGTGTVYSNPLIKSDIDTDMTARTNQMMWGVFIFLRVVGYISVLRGIFMLRASGEGQNVSMMAVSTHLVAGALLANATAFVYAAQETFVKDSANYILKPIF